MLLPITADEYKLTGPNEYLWYWSYYYQLDSPGGLIDKLGGQIWIVGTNTSSVVLWTWSITSLSMKRFLVVDNKEVLTLAKMVGNFIKMESAIYAIDGISSDGWTHRLFDVLQQNDVAIDISG